jgi:hypothetical protein
MGKTASYDAIARGHLVAVKVGRRTLIDVDHGLAWIASQKPLKLTRKVTEQTPASAART